MGNGKTEGQGRDPWLSTGVGSGGVAVLLVATHILIAAIGRPDGYLGFTIGTVPIGIVIGFVSVLAGIVMMYAGLVGPGRLVRGEAP